MYRLYFSELKNKKISTITKADIAVIHNTVGNKNGKYIANRVLALLHALYNKAILSGLQGINPCANIKKFKQKSRERFLQTKELPKFFATLDKEQNKVFRDYCYIALLTGARRSNVLAMNWNDVTFDNNSWIVQETKNDESQMIHLSEQAIKILQHRFESKTSTWVFPSLTSSSGHVEEPKKAWQRIIKRAGITNLRIHDLRRTLGSWQAATGANSYIISKSLGHKTQQATAIYARLNIDPVNASLIF